MKSVSAPISLAGLQLGETRHVCAFFNNDEEEYRILLPSIKDGLYHLGRFGGDAVIDIMRTHPMVIIGGILQHNPFFVPPDEFLREFRQRRASRSSSPAMA
jgi:hypothetical protein